jgi:thiamine transporter ThiT
MSDVNDNNDEFTDFKGRDDPSEDGFTTTEMITGFGMLLIFVGFIFGLIRLLGLKGGETPSDYNNHLEQLYLSYIIMFVGILITSFLGFGGMFKRTISSFIGSND